MVLESIILLVLFGIVSTVFQSIVKNNKQKQVKTDAQRIKPKLQPTNETRSRTNETMSRSYNMEPIIIQEEPRVEPIEIIEPLTMHSRQVMSDSDSNLILTEDITYDDLQRSIIMAEVLGKPKALRRAIR
jgi:hypothetical protein